MKERIKGLEGLRGVSIFSIAFLYHYSVVYGVTFKNSITVFLSEYGYLGVEVFFCISGFVLFSAYFQRLNELSFQEFMKRRIKRLMPLAILSTIVVGLEHVLVITWQLPIMQHVWESNNLLNFIFNILGLQTSVFPSVSTSGQTFNLPLWFLSVVIFCYVWFYIYCKVKSKYRLYCLSGVILGSMWIILNRPMGNALPILNTYTARGVLAFSLGMCVGGGKGF